MPTATRTTTHSLKPGDVLCSSWGYEQTNVDFYQVRRLIGRTMVEVQEMEKHCNTDGPRSMTGRVVPVHNSRACNSKPMRKRVTKDYMGRESLTISGFERALKWDGTPQSISWYG